MKTPTRTAKKIQRSIVPIASFEFESFDIPVRRVNSHRPLPIGAVFRNLNVDPRSSQFKTIFTPIDTAEPAKIFLPSPSPQGREEMRLRLEARPVGPAALPSGNCIFGSQSDRLEALEGESIAPRPHKLKLTN